MHEIREAAYGTVRAAFSWFLNMPWNGHWAAGKEACGVMEPPSKQLRETLLRLKICSVRDFRRAKRRVRRLARDLPAFDFVWIDALLQARRLTPFQARLLESGRACCSTGLGTGNCRAPTWRECSTASNGAC
jgi:hypothetical protein